MEVEFNLIKAEGRLQEKRESLSVASYGEKPTKQAIGNLVTRVMQEYAFSSFADFRTILEHFGVYADRGEKDCKMFENQGLQFFLIGTDGKAKGVPIKASDFHSKPITGRSSKYLAPPRSQEKVIDKLTISEEQKTYSEIQSDN